LQGRIPDMSLDHTGQGCLKARHLGFLFHYAWSVLLICTSIVRPSLFQRNTLFMKSSRFSRPLFVFSLFFALYTFAFGAYAGEKRIAYLVSDARIPFWSIMAEGIKHEAEELGYRVSVFSADNQARKELEFTAKAIEEGVEGIILSPTNSSAAVTVLKLAERAGIPVVISDIGADADNYVSYIKSDNYQGAYDLGGILASALQERGWQKGTVGIVAIPQKRDNGKARTDGFLEALEERDIKSAGILQQSDFSYRETYDHTRTLISRNPALRAVWLQGSDRYQAALNAIADAGKEGEILLICFDAEPEFIEMIANGQLVASGMQQPYLMGEIAFEAMDAHLRDGDTDKVQKVQQVAVLPVSSKNLNKLLPTIKRNVLGQKAEN